MNRLRRSGPTTRQRLALGGGLGVVALAITVAAAAAGTFPVTTSRPARIPVAATTADLVCPGPETLVVPEGARKVRTGGRTAVTAALSAGTGSGDAAASFGRLAVRSESPESSAALSAEPGTVGLRTVRPRRGGAFLVQARPTPAATAPWIAGAQVGLATTGDLRGLTGVACGAALAESWLVAGSAGTGSRSRVLLANPMSLAAVVDLTLLGPEGPIRAPNAEGIVVPPGRQVAVALDALAPGVNRLAVHVVARSGRVSATLFETVLRGLIAGGTDDAAPAAAPARRVVVPGVDLVAAQGAGGSVVRIAVPGTQEAAVSVRLLGPAGSVVVPGGVLAVPAGGVADLPLTRLDAIPPGTYGVVVEADVPVTAAVRLGRGAPGSTAAGTDAALGRPVPPSEFAWTVATPPLSDDPAAEAGRGSATASPPVPATPRPAGPTGQVLVALPALSAVGLGSAAVRIGLSNPTRDPVQVPMRFADASGVPGQEVVVRVPAGTTAVATAPAGSSAVLLPRRAPVHAAVVLTGADAAGPLVSVLPVVPPVTAGHEDPLSVPDARLGLDRDRGVGR